jgi:hypothetical protein
MASFATEAALRAALEWLAAFGLEPGDILVLDGVPHDMRDISEFWPASIPDRPAHAPSASKASSHALAQRFVPYISQFNEPGRYVLIAAIRDSTQEHKICHMLLEHATDAVITRDMPQEAATTESLDGTPPSP